jgi:ABC-2 type transport system permease protein
MKQYVKNFTKYRFLLVELVKKGIKLKYRRSYLGILWTLLEPLMTMMVLTLVFGTFFGKDDPTFPVYILTGRLLYSCFSTSTKGAMKSIRQNAPMIKKVYVPKYMYPLSTIIYEYIIFLISLIVLVAVSGVLKVKPTIYIVQAIVPLVILFVMVLGVGLILSTVAVFFRDLEYIWGVALMLIMYTCAIFYQPERVIGTGNGWVFAVNPLYAVISIFRDAVYYGQVMNLYNLCFSAIFAVGSLIVGIVVFVKNQDKFILNI